MLHLGRRLAGLCLVAALLSLFGPRAWASCGHYATTGAGAATFRGAGVDLPDPTVALPRPPSPWVPAAPCHGLRCSQDTGPASAEPRLVRQTDLWGWSEPRALEAPHASAPVAFDDDGLTSTDRADRLDRPPRAPRLASTF